MKQKTKETTHKIACILSILCNLLLTLYMAVLCARAAYNACLEIKMTEETGFTLKYTGITASAVGYAVIGIIIVAALIAAQVLILRKNVKILPLIFVFVACALALGINTKLEELILCRYTLFPYLSYTHPLFFLYIKPTLVFLTLAATMFHVLTRQIFSAQHTPEQSPLL